MRVAAMMWAVAMTIATAFGSCGVAIIVLSVQNHRFGGITHGLSMMLLAAAISMYTKIER